MGSKLSIAQQQPPAVAKAWLSQYAAAITSGDVDATVSLFATDGWLKDLLTFSWDFRSPHGHDAIKSYLSDSLSAAQISHVQLDAAPGLEPSFFDLGPGMSGVEGAFRFETPTALGRGSMRLLQIGDEGKWKALSVFMMVNDWKGHEEAGCESGVYEGHNVSWEEVRQQRRKAVESDPQALIVGAGQTGLQIAARFRQMNIRAIVVDQEARIGDVWRERYPTLTLHTPRTHHGLLYQPFPKDWPNYTPKEKLASWLEQYAETHDLVVWTSSRVEPTPAYDERSKRWDIVINRNGERVSLHPPHLVMATSLYGDPRMPAIPGLDSFQGECLHASKFVGGAPFKGKRVVVFGSGCTAGDVCQDLVVHGAESVTMVQHSETCVASSKFISMTMSHSYPEGVPTEISDFKFHGTPLSLQRRVMKGMQRVGEEFDKDMHDGLRRAGFKLTSGPNGEGLLILIYVRGGGFFIDAGCTPYIIDGKIKVKHSSDIERVTPTSILSQDRSALEAEVIILATGYEPMRDKLRGLLGDEVIDRTTDIWGTDGDGELRSGYRPSGQPGLWFAVGDFAVSRSYSKQLALFIKAMEIGLTPF